MGAAETDARGYRPFASVLLATVMVGVTGCANRTQPAATQPGPEATVEIVIEAKLLRGLFPHLREERRKGPGEITFDAAFDEVNYARLTEPQSVFKDHCIQSGGTFGQLARSRVSAALMAKPMMTTAQVFEQHKQVYGLMGLSDRAAALTAAFDAELYGSAVRAQYPKAILDTLAAADQAGVFDMFDCRKGERPAWVVMAEPLRFNPMKNPNNLLGSPTMTLYVKGATL